MTEKIPPKLLTVTTAGAFLDALAKGRSEAVRNLLERDVLLRPILTYEDTSQLVDSPIAFALGRLGISEAECAYLAEHFWDAIDYHRSAMFADAAYVVLRSGRRLVRMTVRDHGDHYGIAPGERLPVLTGARILLTRPPKTPPPGGVR